ncbi:MAG: NAD(P)/FAD-dependent oxidoreductase [Candidatus Nanopelagicales bacterium]
MELVNGGVSLWWQQIGMRERFAPLVGDAECDVCIVGGGLTGLWTAYYLAKARPDLRITILEAEFAGYGASGRNGGWLAPSLSGSAARYGAKHGGPPAYERLHHEAARTVDEVIAVCDAEGIDADILRSGLLLAARNGAQVKRLRSALATEPEAIPLNAEEFRSRIRVDGVQGGAFEPHYARVQPAKLVQGLTRVVLDLGVTIHENTRVMAIDPHEAVAQRGKVRARYVLRCLEGYSATIRGHRRTWLPLNSAMITTEPLSEEQWSDIGWSGHELLGDVANVYFYAQRTADDRIAIGGRGVPYRFGSRVDVDGRTQRRTIASLRRTLDEIFPSLRGVAVTHAWCGVLGVPRDWCASVGLDERTGRGWAGGFVGSGLAATNLAARTLRDLVLGDATPLTSMAWTDSPSRRWEPEPLRWLGVSSTYALSRQADWLEARTNRPSRLSAAAQWISGRE